MTNMIKTNVFFDLTDFQVGTGTPTTTTRFDGTFRVINEQTMQVMYESKDAEAWVTDVLWSPEGDTLAVASADGNIYLYNNDDYAIKGEFGDGSVFRLVCPIGVVLKWS